MVVGLIVFINHGRKTSSVGSSGIDFTNNFQIYVICEAECQHTYVIAFISEHVMLNVKCNKPICSYKDEDKQWVSKSLRTSGGRFINNLSCNKGTVVWYTVLQLST